MKRDIPIIISLFSVSFLIRVIDISNVCMYGDEWIYATEVHMILSNNFAPRAEVFKYVNPFLVYIGAVVTLFFGGGLEVIRMVSVIFGSLTIPMLYLFGKAMYDRWTGLLSALFLCFSSFHCLWSRIFMFEALTVFFITAFLYFFWMSQCHERKSLTHACLAGAMMGLAIDAKYISLFLIPAILTYVLWTNKFNFKALMDKRIILIFVFAFLLFLPLLVGLYMAGVGMHPLYYQAVERFEEKSLDRATVVGGSIREMPITELLVGGAETISDMLCRGAEITLQWSALFQLSTMLLFIITLLFYILSFRNGEREGTFLIFFFLIFYAFLFIGCSRHNYYVIYSLPFYFVMLSHFALNSFEHLKKNSNYKNILNIFIILLILIMSFSYFITGITSSQWDEGDASWTKSAVDYVRMDVAKSGYEGDIVIGVVTMSETIDYPLRSISDINAFFVFILSTTGDAPGKLGIVDIEKIDMLKPGYLLMNEPMYEHHFKGSSKTKTLMDYRVAFHYNTYPNNCYILKRKNIEPMELMTSINGKTGKISSDIFTMSVPDVMEVGKVYTALVQVKNTGDLQTNFTARVHSDEYTIFVEAMRGSVTLDKGSTHLFKFKMLPIQESVEELPIIVDLYVKDEKNETRVKVDSILNYIHHVKK